MTSATALWNTFIGEALSHNPPGRQVMREQQYRRLTPRQCQIATLAVKGFSNKQIARELNIREGTVKMHLHKVYERLGIGNRTSLAALFHKIAAE